jgi:hypothetical protein
MMKPCIPVIRFHFPVVLLLFTVLSAGLCAPALMGQTVATPLPIPEITPGADSAEPMPSSVASVLRVGSFSVSVIESRESVEFSTESGILGKTRALFHSVTPRQLHLTNGQHNRLENLASTWPVLLADSVNFLRRVIPAAKKLATGELKPKELPPELQDLVNQIVGFFFLGVFFSAYFWCLVFGKRLWDSSRYLVMHPFQSLLLGTMASFLGLLCIAFLGVSVMGLPLLMLGMAPFILIFPAVMGVSAGSLIVLFYRSPIGAWGKMILWSFLIPGTFALLFIPVIGDYLFLCLYMAGFGSLILSGLQESQQSQPQPTST